MNSCYNRHHCHINTLCTNNFLFENTFEYIEAIKLDIFRIFEVNNRVMFTVCLWRLGSFHLFLFYFRCIIMTNCIRILQYIYISTFLLQWNLKNFIIIVNSLLSVRWKIISLLMLHGILITTNRSESKRSENEG